MCQVQSLWEHGQRQYLGASPSHTAQFHLIFVFKKRKKELIISETHQKYYDLNTNNKKEQSIRFGSGSVHLKESFLKALCGNNFMFFSSLKLLDVSRIRSLPSAYSDLVGR